MDLSPKATNMGHTLEKSVTKSDLFSQKYYYSYKKIYDRTCLNSHEGTSLIVKHRYLLSKFEVWYNLIVWHKQPYKNKLTLWAAM